ncbi:MAG: hypothetical protein IMZ61_00295 [Planctomycetes bacterium]|nr:hypothetical protein [Planctomycetota bacterium]
MTNLLWTFQNRVTHLQPSLLLTLAVVTIAAGLFVWLGGLGFKKIVFVAIGLFFGAFCTLFSSGTNPFLAAAIIGICAMLAFTLQDTFLVLIASALAAVIGYSMLVRPYFRPSGDIMSVIRQLTIGVPYYNWPIMLALTAVPFAAVSWKGASALFSSAAGTTLILAGTIMVLLNLGYPAVGYMTTRQDIYIAIIALATILGTITQLWLMPKISTLFVAAKAKVKKVKARKGNAEATAKTATWRTA